MFQAVLALAAAGVVAAIVLAFWAEIQNWIANVIEHGRAVLGPLTHTLQSALVILDKVVVSGQRMIAVTARTVFQEKDTHRIVVREEKRLMEPQALPKDILDKLDKGQTLSYDVGE